MGCGAVILTTLLMIFTGTTVCGRKILNERVICQSDGPQTLTCPINHIVVIRTAMYYRSLQPGCHSTDNNTCFISDTYALFRKCYKAQPCQIEVGAVSSRNCSSDYKGEVYLKIMYLCEPQIGKSAKTIDMCSESTWTGSMAYIWSPGFPVYTDVPHCACSIRLHQPVELHITVPYFEPSPSSRIAVPSMDYCAQSLTFWNNTVLNRICASHEDTLELVSVMDATQVYVQYKSIPILQSSFFITVQVHHEEKMTINCSSTYLPPPPHSLTTRPTLPYVPTSRMTRPTTKRPTIPPTLATTTHPFMRTTRRVHVVPTTHPNLRSTAPPQPTRGPSTLPGGRITHTTTHSPTTRAQPVLVDKAQWPLITGVVAALMVIIVLVTALLLFCRRSGHKKANAYGHSELANFTFENVVYMTSTEVAALHIGPETAAAAGSSTGTVTVEVDKHCDTSVAGSEQVVAEKELHCDVTSCANCDPTPYTSCDPTPYPSCDPTPYTSMTDLSVKDHATLMENQPGCL